jgi:hypothetical protein
MPSVFVSCKQTISFFLISSQNSGYCKRNFTPQQFKLRTFTLRTESNYIFWFKVSSKLFNLSDDLIFGIVYIPPEGSSYLSPDAFDQVENEYRVLSQNYKYICLLGDLRFNIIF